MYKHNMVKKMVFQITCLDLQYLGRSHLKDQDLQKLISNMEQWVFRKIKSQGLVSCSLNSKMGHPLATFTGKFSSLSLFCH